MDTTYFFLGKSILNSNFKIFDLENIIFIPTIVNSACAIIVASSTNIIFLKLNPNTKAQVNPILIINTNKFKIKIIFELPLAFSKPINTLLIETKTNSTNCKLKYKITSEDPASGTAHNNKIG